MARAMETRHGATPQPWRTCCQVDAMCAPPWGQDRQEAVSELQESTEFPQTQRLARDVPSSGAGNGSEGSTSPSDFPQPPPALFVS